MLHGQLAQRPPLDAHLKRHAELKRAVKAIKAHFPPDEDDVVHQCDIDELSRLHAVTHDGTAYGLWTRAWTSVAIAICARALT